MLYGDTPWCCARRNSAAARSPPATCSCSKTVYGGSHTIMPAKSSRPAGCAASLLAVKLSTSFSDRCGSIKQGDDRLCSAASVEGSPDFSEASRSVAVDQTVERRRAEAPLKGGNGAGRLGAWSASNSRCGPGRRARRPAARCRRRGRGAARARAGAGQIPMPARARRGQSRDNSPGSDLRSGAMSECPTTRTAGIEWRDKMSRQRAFDRRHLRFGKRAVAPFVAGIDDLDPDRDEIEVALACQHDTPA